MRSTKISAQLLKRQVFSDFKRPSKVFENIADLQFVPGVSYSKEIDLKIRQEVTKLFGEGTSIQLHNVSTIKRPESVKRKYIYRHDQEPKT